MKSTGGRPRRVTDAQVERILEWDEKVVTAHLADEF